MKSARDVSQLIKSFGTAVEHRGPQKADNIRAFEQIFELRVPNDYRQFLVNYGFLSVGDVSIIGIGQEDINITAMKLTLHDMIPDLSLDFVPIEILSDSH